MIEEYTPLQDELEKHIRKLVRPLKDEDELNIVLKTKLTKKEFKVFKAWANGEELAPLLERLSIDSDRYTQLKEKLIKKINQEKFKQEIMI
jgi:ubiquinone/menaquinone biosynthesis C-methylase UbiE